MQPTVRENDIEYWSQVQSFTFRKHRNGFWFIAVAAKAILMFPNLM